MLHLRFDDNPLGLDPEVGPFVKPASDLIRSSSFNLSPSISLNVLCPLHADLLRESLWNNPPVVADHHDQSLEVRLRSAF